ncbi:MAG: hypothetical protein M9962_01260 [Oligoflexia bacterium]|nr:hypothetical protein [Oligoflexia bacterium]
MRSTHGSLQKNDRGQAFLEYILVMAVVVGILLVFAKPFFGNFSKKLQDGLQKGIFTEDPTGANFYYFPLR